MLITDWLAPLVDFKNRHGFGAAAAAVAWRASQRAITMEARINKLLAQIIKPVMCRICNISKTLDQF
jgi:hypothetical protein